MKERSTKESEQLKSEFEYTRSDVKKCCDHCKKGKQYLRQITYTNQGHLPIKVTPIIDFTEKQVIHCDVPVVGNTFVDD